MSDTYQERPNKHNFECCFAKLVLQLEFEVYEEQFSLVDKSLKCFVETTVESKGNFMCMFSVYRRRPSHL